MEDFLFEEFSNVSAKQWKQKIQFDLKGADFNETLLTKTNEGITIKPFYHQDTYKEIKVPTVDETFSICQSIFVNDEKIANFLALDAINRGANSLKFTAKNKFNCEILFENLIADSNKNVSIYFEFQFIDETFLMELMKFANDKNIYLNIDIIGNLAKSGNWFHNNKQDHHILASLLKKISKNTGVIAINVDHYQNGGANIVQQIAYALSHANEYLNFIFMMYDKNELSMVQLERIVNNMQFNFSIGDNYFFEIAKLRSFRVLWRLLLKEYNLNFKANIFSEPSIRNKSIYDYNVNMLRTTTECMSAILGGANTIGNLAYDSVFHKKNEFGERIARNQLIILKEESKIRNSDITEGAYYIEQITSEFADKALIIFKEIEKNGGFVKQLFQGTIQRKIHESAQKEQAQFDANDKVIIGVNKYPNNDDRMNKELELYPFQRRHKRETLINPILTNRLAEKMEKIRIDGENKS